MTTALPRNREYRDKDESSQSDNSNLDGDRSNFCLLLTLYMVQGFPIGLSNALPIILQSKKSVTYGDQAVFSVVVWPFTIKLLWAPIIDAFYVRRVGRRKCWLIPLQLLMATFLFNMAVNIDEWLPESGRPNLRTITIIVFALNFLSAIQDIVVDGWSLTMLKKKNVNYASVCNSVGISFGMFVGSICFVLLVSEKFNVKYFGAAPDTGGLVSMKSFLYFWVAVVCATTVAAFFKKEKNIQLDDDHEKTSVHRTYKLLWNILKLPRIRVLAIALLTSRFGFIATDSISHLKLIDAGVSKDDIALMNMMAYGMKFATFFFMSKYITGVKPMSYYFKMVPIRLLLGVVYATLIYYTPSLIDHNARVLQVSIHYYYYSILGLVVLANELLSMFMIMAVTALFCQISDPRFGGMYMTLYNTFLFLGWFVSNTFVLKLTELSTTSGRCSNDSDDDCSTFRNLCKMNGGICKILVDGYYVTMFVCIAFGIVWYFVFRNVIKKYQSLSLGHWTVSARRSDSTTETDDVVTEFFIRSSSA